METHQSYEKITYHMGSHSRHRWMAYAPHRNPSQAG